MWRTFRVLAGRAYGFRRGREGDSSFACCARRPGRRHVTQHHLDLRGIHHFADGEEAELIRGFAHELKARLTHALEGVG